jgi:hypothetical protein
VLVKVLRDDILGDSGSKFADAGAPELLNDPFSEWIGSILM